ncbi:hypothetical protein ATANTOWER_008619 [Ataeniobius toweri]|uniref:Uncharacterized protein n=1 Tax=Ataeniobius toweri TaxID=208326 RepID=A0ABU7BZ82_9TELE|nr:hypothetical protein [Ataeniobius toweri]
MFSEEKHVFTLILFISKGAARGPSTGVLQQDDSGLDLSEGMKTRSVSGLAVVLNPTMHFQRLHQVVKKLFIS